MYGSSRNLGVYQWPCWILLGIKLGVNLGLGIAVGGYLIRPEFYQIRNAKSDSRHKINKREGRFFKFLGLVPGRDELWRLSQSYTFKEPYA